MKKNKKKYLLGDIIGLISVAIVFIVPFIFIFVNSLKDRKDANLLELSWPSELLWGNYWDVISTNNFQLLTAFKNSISIAFGSVILIVITCSMSAYVLQRRKDKIMGIYNTIIMTGLMLPAAILPTITILQGLNLYKTLFGLILVEVALQTPFTVILYRGFMGTLPIELEESGYLDGCTRTALFTKIIFPLLKPITATVIILNAVIIFNDFTNALYFLPGSKNTTVQLTLHSYTGAFASSYNLLFADVVLITLPMLILFLFFNKRIVDGMTAGSVKG